MNYAGLVLKHLLRNKRRTLLTIFSIAISLFVFSALASLPAVADQLLANSASSFRIACHNKAGLRYPLPEAYKARIASTPHVVAVVAESWFGGIYHEVTDQFPNLAIDPDQVEIMWPDWELPVRAVEDFKRMRTACLVAPGTMKRFNLRVGQQIALRGTNYPFNVTLRVVGVMGVRAPPNLLVFRRDYLEEAAGRRGFLANFWVRVDSPAAAPRVARTLDSQFANSSAETQSESEAAFLGNYVDNFRTFFKLAQALGLIVVLTIGLVAANTAAMAIRERRAEIAVMRSIGFPSRVILTLLLAESIIISVAGGLLGSGVAFTVLKVFSVGSAAIAPLAMIRMPRSVLADTLLIAVLIGPFSVYVPASVAARRNIVDALRMAA